MESTRVVYVKLVAVDDDLAMVGSVHVDARSLVLNEQVVLLIDDRTTAATLNRHFEEDLRHSRRTTQEEWTHRGRPRRALESVAYTLARPIRGMGAASLTAPRPLRRPVRPDDT